MTPDHFLALLPGCIGIRTLHPPACTRRIRLLPADLPATKAPRRAAKGVAGPPPTTLVGVPIRLNLSQVGLALGGALTVQGGGNATVSGGSVMDITVHPRGGLR
eukprot:SAG25_NODE_1437_length_3023_cov_2.829343_6_plen_103_part_01